MKPLLISAVLACAAATPASAIDYPVMKPGLWETTMSRDAKKEPSTMKMCIDKDVQKEMMDMGTSARKEMCSKLDMNRSGNRITGHSVCQLGNTKMVSDSVTTFSGEGSYHTEADSTYDPPMGTLAKNHSVVDGKWVGPCPPDMSPGDMVMPGGKKVNVRQMMDQQKKAAK